MQEDCINLLFMELRADASQMLYAMFTNINEMTVNFRTRRTIVKSSRSKSFQLRTTAITI